MELPPRRSTGGNLDLLFAIDRSPDLPVDLTNQLKLAAELVDELTDEDINDERVRIAIVSFANVSYHFFFSFVIFGSRKESGRKRKVKSVCGFLEDTNQNRKTL